MAQLLHQKSQQRTSCGHVHSENAPVESVYSSSQYHNIMETQKEYSSPELNYFSSLSNKEKMQLLGHLSDEEKLFIFDSLSDFKKVNLFDRLEDDYQQTMIFHTKLTN